MPFAVGWFEAHQRRDAVEVPNPPKRSVLSVESEIADARVSDQQATLPCPWVEGTEIAPVVVVGGVEELLRVRVVDQRGYEIQRGAADFVEPAVGAVIERE